MLTARWNAIATPTSDRFVVWIDGVGAFLLLTKEVVTVGRVASMTQDSNEEADIALMGNLSRQHLTLKRVADDYVIEPHSRTTLQGRGITEPTLLPSRAELALNDAVRLKVEVPSPLSASARVEVLSNHRGKQSVNGIVLMADTCLLGPGLENHVRCSSWSSQLVLVRRGSGLAMKSRELLIVDGVRQQGWIELQHGQTVEGGGLRFRIEGSHPSNE